MLFDLKTLRGDIFGGVASAVILLAFMFGLGPLVVPAGILMKVGWDIIDWRFLLRIHQAATENVPCRWC